MEIKVGMMRKEHERTMQEVLSSQRRTLAMRTIALARNTMRARNFRALRVHLVRWRRVAQSEVVERRRKETVVLVEKGEVKFFFVHIIYTFDL
jgi:hypothetical protein